MKCSASQRASASRGVVGASEATIDGLGPDNIADKTLRLAQRAGALQTGYVYHYALAMLLGVVALATWFMVSGGAP